MGCAASTPLSRSKVPEGKTRLCVSGFGLSHHTGKARQIVDTIVREYPEEYESYFYFDTKGFRPDFIDAIKSELSEEQQNEFKDHNTSPFCWLETADGEKPYALGGRDNLCEWVVKNLSETEKSKKILKLCGEEPSKLKDALVSKAPGTAST
jgi:hypothetical protein